MEKYQYEYYLVIVVLTHDITSLNRSANLYSTVDKNLNVTFPNRTPKKS